MPAAARRAPATPATAHARHPGNDPDPSRRLTTLARDYRHQERVPLHRHLRGQLIYASEGIMNVATAHGRWLVPPQQAVWVPPEVDHETTASRPLAMRSIYVHPDAARELPAECRVVNVPALLRELILEVVERADGELGEDELAHLHEVILDRLRRLEPAPLDLPLPRDARARTVARALMEDPGDGRTLAAWASRAGASERTLARAFVGETGLSFGAWRQRLRLMTAVSRLAGGASVTAVALDLGYHSPSAFIAMFRRTMGVSPTRFVRRTG